MGEDHRLVVHSGRLVVDQLLYSLVCLYDLIHFTAFTEVLGLSIATSMDIVFKA